MPVSASALGRVWNTTTPEISARVGYARRTVRRTLETIRNRLRRLQAEEQGVG